MEELGDLFAEGCGAAGYSFHAGEVVVGYDGVVDEADDEGWDEDEFADLVVGDGLEHEVHVEVWEHDEFVVEEDGAVHEFDEAGD